jgi:hypothetical protein
MSDGATALCVCARHPGIGFVCPACKDGATRESEIQLLRRSLRAACKLLDMAAADLSTCARASDDGRPLRAADLRQRSSDYAMEAHRLLPRRRR